MDTDFIEVLTALKRLSEKAGYALLALNEGATLPAGADPTNPEAEIEPWFELKSAKEEADQILSNAGIDPFPR